MLKWIILFLRINLRKTYQTLPEIFDDLSGMLKDPNSSTHAILEVMRADQTLSMKVLRVANSVQYRGERERVTDVAEAIGTLVSKNPHGHHYIFGF